MVDNVVRIRDLSQRTAATSAAAGASSNTIQPR